MKAIETAIVRILRNKTTLGTGFFVASTGEILTCDHVIADVDDLSVVASDGTSEIVVKSKIHRSHDCDVALISTSIRPPAIVPLASIFPENGFRFWTKGFQYGNIGVTSSFPLSGTISGTTSVRYDTYNHKEVFVLTEAPIDHGLSGAPLVDVSSGVAVGIVIAKIPDSVRQIGGFALPISSLALYEPFGNLIRRNRDEVPSFGQFGNLLGLRKLTQMQSSHAIETLESSRLFLPQQEVPREDLYAEASVFRESDSQVFPIIGYSGAGKTFSLAALAVQWTSNHPVLFLRGFDLTDSDLSVAVVNAIEKVASDEALPSIPVSSWITVLNENNTKLIVFLDGLNEAPQGVRREIDSWLMRTFTWLSGKPVQLVISCKPDFWDSVDSIFHSASSKVHFPKHKREIREDESESPADKNKSPTPEPFRMSDFSSGEIEAALEAYSLSDAGIALNEVGHPSLLRIYSEVAASRTDRAVHSVDRYLVFERFVDLKIQKVARNTGSIKGVVSDLLARAAKTSFKLRTYELASEIFFSNELFGQAREIAQELIREHVFIDTTNGYRFSFEEVAEFLHSRFVDVERISEYTNEYNSIAVSALSFALLRLERENRIDELRRAASTLLVTATSRRVSWTVIRALSWLERPAVILDLIEEFSGKLDEYLLEALLNELKLPIAETFRLMHILARLEDSYPWEPKHWHTSENLFVRSKFEEMLERDAPTSFAEVSKWLEDKTPLRGGLGGESVSTVALGLMFQYRAHDLPLIAETLAPIARGDGYEFFYRMARHGDLNELDPVLTSWLEREDRQAVAAHVIHLFLSENADRNGVAVDMLLQLVTSAQDDNVRAFALEMLSRFPEHRDEDSFRKLTALMREGNSSVDSPYTLIRFLQSRFDDVIALLKERYLRDADTRASTVNALSHFNGASELRLEILYFVRHIWESNSDSARAIAHFVESRFYVEEPRTALFNSLQQLGIDIAGSVSEEATRRVLIFAATAKGPLGYTPEQLPLIDAIVATERNPTILRFLVKELATLIPEVPEIAVRTDRILPILGSNRATGLVLDIQVHPEIDRLVARWIQQGKLPLENKLLKAIAEALQAGLDPSDAANRARDIFHTDLRAANRE